MVEICRALASDCRILLMDEPTSSLQRADVDRLFALIGRLRAQGLGIVYISHFLEEVREIADVCTVLRDGRSVATGGIADVTNEQLVAHMVGRPVENLFPPAPRHDAGRGRARRSRTSRAPPAVRSASFELRRGEVLGIAGLMGSGRTEMVRAIFGLDPIASGEVTVSAGRRTSAERRFVRACCASGSRPAWATSARTARARAWRCTMSLADNITLTELRRVRDARVDPPRRAARAGDAAGCGRSACARARPTSPP